jgi:hypothetical protein
MQRLHEDDLTGHLLARGGRWTHSAIQARADEVRTIRWTAPRKPSTEAASTHVAASWESWDGVMLSASAARM